MTWHVVPAAVATYAASAGREVAPSELPLLAHGAARIATVDGLEAWRAVTDSHRVTLYAVRWRAHAVILGVSVRDADDETLEGAEWTRGALEQYDASRGVLDFLDIAETELALACADARPVDVAAAPERWRWRSGLLGLDVSLVVQRVDAEGTPLVVSAVGRAGPASARAARRGRGR